MSTSLRHDARLLSGEVSGSQILCPGPGHNPKDRSLSLKPSASSPIGYVVHSFAGDDINECKDHVRAKLDLPEFTPGRRPIRPNRGPGNGGTPPPGPVDEFSYAQHEDRNQKTNDGFFRGQNDEVLKGHHGNVRHAVDLLGVGLRHNEFSTQTEIRGLAGFGTELNDAGADQIRFLIEETYGFLPPKELFNDTLGNIAHRNGFHPVREYLASLEWDGAPRIDNWLFRYGGAEETTFNKAIGRIFLIAAVRRVRQPGVKFDTMLVLESPIQGKNKSSALRILATREEWFSDSLPLGADTKEVIEQTTGIWIAECAELNGLKTREEEHIMAFLSRQVDKARPAYGRRRENVPRQFVAFATTNEEEYLKKDERRLWPVRIEKFDLDALKRDVNQLWAEAAYYEAMGDSIVLAEDLWSVAAEVRADREFDNPYLNQLSRAFREKTIVRGSAVWERLEIPPERQPREAVLVGRAMKKVGFTHKYARGGCEVNGLSFIRNEGYYLKEKANDGR